MKKQTKLFILSFALMCSLATPAYANAGTPLMWAGMLHLVFGNLAIGLGEGLLLAFIFRLPKFKSIGMMVLANYISAWMGYLILENLQPFIDRSITIYEIQNFIWAAYGIAFAFTVIAELPLIFIIMRQKQHAIIRTLIASLVIQSLSYCGIFFWYRGASFDSLFSNTHIVQSFESRHPQSMLYFIGEDHNIYQMRLDGSEMQRIHAPNEKMKLYLQPFQTGAHLCICSESDFYSEEKEGCIVIKENILPAEQIDAIDIDESRFQTKAIDYRPSAERQWEIYCGFWAAEGLRLWNDETDQHYSIALETPFAQWYVRSVTVLPGDEVIFQMGNQICLYLRSTQKLALLTKGTSPVVILDENSPTLNTETE